jgi:hypothetical protein
LISAPVAEAVSGIERWRRDFSGSKSSLDTQAHQLSTVSAKIPSSTPVRCFSCEEPRLTPSEVDAVVAFLETLTDGYSAAAQ